MGAKRDRMPGGGWGKWYGGEGREEILQNSPVDYVLKIHGMWYMDPVA